MDFRMGLPRCLLWTRTLWGLDGALAGTGVADAELAVLLLELVSTNVAGGATSTTLGCFAAEGISMEPRTSLKESSSKSSIVV